jgi:hypothetical protein
LLPFEPEQAPIKIATRHHATVPRPTRPMRLPAL